MLCEAAGYLSAAQKDNANTCANMSAGVFTTFDNSV